MKLEALSPRFVKNVPRPMEPGVLYISLEYGAALHLCPCGCENEVVTPLGAPLGWTLTRDGDEVTLQPSILNRFECKTHYFIVRNQIQWA